MTHRDLLDEPDDDRDDEEDESIPEQPKYALEGTDDDEEEAHRDDGDVDRESTHGARRGTSDRRWEEAAPSFDARNVHVFPESIVLMIVAGVLEQQQQSTHLGLDLSTSR